MNIFEIIKNQPGEKMKTWTPLFGECIAKAVDNEIDVYPVEALPTGEPWAFDINGRFCSEFSAAECVLFPSKENRDWSLFAAANKYVPFEEVLVREGKDGIWVPTLYAMWDKNAAPSKEHHVVIGYAQSFCDDDILPYAGNGDKIGKVTE